MRRSCTASRARSLSAKAEILMRRRAHFRRAIEIAMAQQSKALELRSATSLARLYREQNRASEARS